MADSRITLANIASLWDDTTRWEQLDAGVFLVSGNNVTASPWKVGTRGGYADSIVVSHDHTFSGDTMPQHNHIQDPHSHNGGDAGGIGDASAGAKYSIDETTDISWGSKDDKLLIFGDDKTVVASKQKGSSSRPARRSSSSGSTGVATASNSPASAGRPTGDVNSRGVSGANRNIPPYVACNIFIRVG
jgi:hypothetical protein